MKDSTRRQLDQIERKYNPDHDRPDGIEVTWADYYLLEAIKELHEELESMKARVNELEAAWAMA